MSVRVLIGIQARMTSKRLPGKCKMLIGGVPVLERVIIAAQKCQNFLHYSNKRPSVAVEVCLLVPFGDPLGEEFRRFCPVIEGPEDDVLTRYNTAMTTFQNPDYMVRITADCPLLPSKIISKHILNAVSHNYDYLSNVDPRTRTAPDGHDCEVISSRLMRWVNENATEPWDREHVTTLIRSNPPPWAEMASMIDYVDQSHLKLSLDTEEDLLFIRTYFDILNKKLKAGAEIGGVFRI